MLIVFSLEEEMATHSSILAWRIPLTEEPGGVQSYQGLWRPWGDKESPWGHKEPDTTEGTGRAM